MIVCVVSSHENSARVLSFSYFPINFFVLILLICTMKMAALSQASGKLNGQKSSDQVYVGSTIAVVACNLVLRNPSESEFLRSEAFLSLKRTINKHVLKESDIDHRPAQDLCCVSTDRDSKSDEGETPQELKGEKLSLESSFPGSPPKCSTPRRQSPARQTLKSVSVRHRLRTADCRLRTRDKLQIECKMQTAD